jgi:hypothetical protein
MIDVESLLRLARAGNGPAVGQFLEGYHSYVTLLARLQIRRRLQGHRRMGRTVGSVEKLCVRALDRLGAPSENPRD